MQSSGRENEETLKKIENIRDCCMKCLCKVNELLDEMNNSVVINKEKLLEDITFVSHNTHFAFKLCDPLFRNYTTLPAISTNEDMLGCLQPARNHEINEYENKLLKDINYEDDDDDYMDIDCGKQDEKKIETNIKKLSKNLSVKLRDYTKEIKKNANPIHKQE